MAPTTTEGPGGTVERASVRVVGGVTHSLVRRWSAPARDDRTSKLDPHSIGLASVDHVALCVPAGQLDTVCRFYADAFGFVSLHEESVATDYSAMRSRAVQNESGSVKLVVVEPAEVPGGGEGQIDGFLRNHGGPGIQHVAFLVDDILAASAVLGRRGIEFLDIPEEYYDALPERVGVIEEDFAALRGTGVLVDRDEWGYLLQQFSKPMLSRDTFFLEIIQRHDARGFGSGNIRALYEAVERRQRAVGGVPAGRAA